MKPSHLLRLAPLVCASLVLAACSSAAGTGSSAKTPGAGDLVVMTPAATSNLDKVTWNEPEGEPATIDPYLSVDYTPNTINSNMCENLMAYYPDYSFKPNLASSAANPDPLTWVYTLRSGVTFWDGSPMTSDDVAYSLNRNLKDAGSFYHYLYSSVKSVDVTGPLEVTVHLTKPDYLFNKEMADYAGVVVQKKFALAHPKDMGSPNVGLMCTGPYQFKSWTKGDNITMTAYPGYWDNANRKPKVSTIVFKFLTDEAAQTSALQTGDIDGMYDPPLSGLTQLKASSEGKLFYGPMDSNLTIVYSNPKGSMGNLKMRQALQLATDWDGMAKVIMKGTATPIKAMFPPNVFDDAKAQLQPAYDALPPVQSGSIDKAKALVAAAGEDGKKPVVFAVGGTFTGIQFGNSVVDAAKKAGMNASLKVVPAAEYGGYLYDPKTRAGVDILFTDFWPNIPNALDWVGITSATGGSFNQYGYNGIDSLYDQARATADPAEQGKIQAQIMTKLTDELLTMAPGLSRASRLFMNKRVTGAPASFSYVYFPWAVYLGGTGS
ncbi:ABC transporter substrate-binding protein [Angustibacter sp. McL0619]|uniref:ABC transporter substrate-binding protein n=1 Tax=Angustibacter sp. McL0619 TaxID=3415676 RepID=UPI003CE94778